MPAFAIILPKCPVAMIKSNKFPISLRDNRPFVIRGVDCKLGIDSRPILDTGLVQRLKTKSREFPLMVIIFENIDKSPKFPLNQDKKVSKFRISRKKKDKNSEFYRNFNCWQ